MIKKIKQQTISYPISCSGIGLHTGKRINMLLKPAKIDSGIIFKRVDKTENNEIVALYNNVSDCRLNTTISNEHNVSVSTGEHLISALWGTGIDNIIIEIDGAEVPIMDGSAQPFVFLIDSAGKTYQNKNRQYIQILKEIKVEHPKNKEIYCSIKPCSTKQNNSFILNLTIEYDNPVIQKQQFTFDSSKQFYYTDIALARTFALKKEIEFIQSQGLAKGGSLNNAIVVGENEILNDEPLRYYNEFVRHKILDAIGDLYLAGNRILGYFQGNLSGHYINNLLLRSLFSSPDNYQYIS